MLGDVVKKKFMADTGASITIAGMSFVRELGLREEDLLEPGLVITSADNSGIKVMGVALVRLSTEEASTLELVYICRGTKGCLLSLEACMALGWCP